MKFCFVIADGPSNTELNIMYIILISNGILLVLLIVVLIVCVLKKHPNQHRRLISTFNELQVTFFSFSFSFYWIYCDTAKNMREVRFYAAVTF